MFGSVVLDSVRLSDKLSVLLSNFVCSLLYDNVYRRLLSSLLSSSRSYGAAAVVQPLHQDRLILCVCLCESDG